MLYSIYTIQPQTKARHEVASSRAWTPSEASTQAQLVARRSGKTVILNKDVNGESHNVAWYRSDGSKIGSNPRRRSRRKAKRKLARGYRVRKNYKRYSRRRGSKKRSHRGRGGHR